MFRRPLLETSGEKISFRSGARSPTDSLEKSFKSERRLKRIQFSSWICYPISALQCSKTLRRKGPPPDPNSAKPATRHTGFERRSVMKPAKKAREKARFDRLTWRKKWN